MWRSLKGSRRRGLFGVGKRHITFGSETAQELHDARIRAPHSSLVRFPTRITGRQRLRLHLKIDFGVDVGSVDGNMAQPRTNGVDIHARAQEMRCGCVADDVRANPFFSQRWNLLSGPPRMPLD